MKTDTLQSPPAGDDELYRLASLIGCEPENEVRHRNDLSAYILAQVLELLQSEWLDVYSIASSPQVAVAQAKANYKSQLEQAAQARFGEEGKH